MMKKLFFLGLLLFSVIAMAQFNNVNNQIRMNQQHQRQVQIMNNQFRMMNQQQQQFMNRMMRNAQGQKVSLQNSVQIYQGNIHKLEYDKKEIESQIAEKQIQLESFKDTEDTKSQQKAQREIEKLLKKTAKIDSKINKNKEKMVDVETKIAENQKKLEETRKKKADKESQKAEAQNTGE